MKATKKQMLRETIWSKLENLNLIRGPHTCFGRIPNFKGAAQTARRLRNTIEWKRSSTIFSSPDSALREVRENALKDEKLLIMASPKLKRGYLRIDPKNTQGAEKIASTIKGAFIYGETLERLPKIQLVVEGSLAVDLHGNRLGKGGGYADKEISHLFHANSIDEKTPIVTTIHSLQIVSEIPMEAHDRKINMIVIPEKIIRI